MSKPDVVIVGAGVSGLATAWALSQRGFSPTIVSRGVGASMMTSGAFDLTPWTLTPAGVPSERALEFLRDLGLLEQGTVVATTEGLVRPTAAVGARVLPLDRVGGKKIGVVECGRADFPSERLAADLSRSSWAIEQGVSFQSLPAEGLLDPGEERMPLAALVSCFNSQARLERLYRLAAQHSSVVDALLVGPWLGEGTSRLPGDLILGETLSPPDGAFGRRMARALLTKAEAWGLVEGTVEVVHPEDESVRVELKGAELSSTSGESSTIWAHAVVLATGGLIGGGVTLLSDEERPSELAPSLGEPMVFVSGARDGWDATSDGGRWVSPPHWEGAHSGAPRVHHVGDVRAETSSDAPGGTVFGAIESALRVADRIERPNAEG